MKITFHSIRAKNFLQIGNEFESFQLNKSPFTVIVGKNGSGKSTILDMITYALYKKAYRPKVTLGQLINSVNKKQMVVEIAFSVGASTYVVRRGEKPKLFEIYRDRKLIEPDPSVGDMQKYLEQIILGRSYKTFCQIDIVGKATYKQFLDLDAAQRRAVVEDIMDSGIYSVMQGYAKEDLKRLNLEDGDINRDICVIESKISTTRSFMETMKDNRDQDIADAERQLADIDQRIVDLTTKLTESKSRCEYQLTKVDQIIPPQHRKQFADLISKVTSEIGGYNSTIARNDGVIAKIDDMETCPHCMQVVDDNHKHEIVTQSTAEISKATKGLVEAREKLDKYERIKAEYDAARQLYDQMVRETERISFQIDSERQAHSVQSNRIIKLKQPVVVDPNLPNIDSLNNDLADKIRMRDEVLLKIDQTKQAIKLLGDDGIKAKLIEKYVPMINKTVNDYLERMGMFVEFTLDGEFNETINAINREGFTYNSFSEGQKQRIDLALLMTWRAIAQIRNSTTTNLFVLDEIADGSLDEEGMNEFINILKSVSDAQNTFIISHKDSTIDLFDSSIRAETVGNFTRYTHSE